MQTLVRTQTLVLSLVALGACSGPQPGASAPAPVRDQVRIGAEGGRSQTVDIHTTSPTSSQTVAMSIERAWRALPIAYESLGFQIIQLQEASRTIAGQRLRARGTFAGERFSRLLNCGETAGLPNADRYDVSLTVVTSLEQAGEGTLVSTDVQAVATPNTTAGAQVRCVANARIGEIVAARVREAIVQ
jgi:hypothetical protein